MAKYTWNGTYRPNLFTPDNDKDQLVDVETAGSAKDEDIVDDIIKEGIEINKSTLLDIIRRYEDAVAKRVLSGYSYSNSFVQMQPRVTGVFADINSAFDPAIHKCTIDMGASAPLRAELANVDVKIRGSKEAAKIGSVENSATGAKDGVITIGDDVIIEGDKIKVQDEKDKAQGVFFVDSTGEHRVERKLSINRPKQVMARVPAEVSEGEVKLIIRTTFSGGSTTLKNPREIVYAYKLKATK